MPKSSVGAIETTCFATRGIHLRSTGLEWGMHRRLSALWIPLFAPLLAGPVAQHAPRDVGLGDAIVWTGDSLSSSVQSNLPAATLQPALNRRVPVGRGPGALWCALPVRPASPISNTQLLTPPALPDGSPLTRSARLFPLFPTGPPSRS